MTEVVRGTNTMRIAFSYVLIVVYHLVDILLECTILKISASDQMRRVQLCSVPIVCAPFLVPSMLYT
ncbi:hypothetical protein BOTBODRAFT_566400 [Botryobasidium botryosum FD-172 SS1]|uniref:Uncharacterized protein n=1 Tax=Botryobasidium botryosum (strain FD-172 SS1) TaxID=930990 RepID=A0A067MA55_BOTB1|nr:hypothetical protein BOTBODRAFT_566400 [Botryobasidium botryosum FD-172 SS1]